VARTARVVGEPVRSAWQFFAGGSGNADGYQADVTAGGA
jgi:hypothetical protein